MNGEFQYNFPAAAQRFPLDSPATERLRLYIGWTAIRALVFGDPVAGWPSLACIITFFAGLQLFCGGIIGMYLAKAYLEVKGRPIYIVKEKDEKLE